MAKPSRRLVIDATIVRAAGKAAATNAEAIRCRDLLDLILEGPHCCVVGADLHREWLENASSYARTWVRQMYVKRKIVRSSDIGRPELREPVRVAVAVRYPPEAWPKIEKDIHLLQAALTYDRIIISDDRHARLAYTFAARQVRELGRICWVEPAVHGDLLFRWLRGEAEASRAWNLDPSRESA